jgi:hypothetical protein
VLREGLRLVEQRAAEDDSTDDLQVYLNGFSEKVISRAGE